MLLRIATLRDEYKTYINTRSKIILIVWLHSEPIQKLGALLNVLKQNFVVAFSTLDNIVQATKHVHVTSHYTTAY